MLRVKGRPKDGYNGLEVSVDRQSRTRTHNRRGAGRWLVHRRADDGTVRCDAARARA